MADERDPDSTQVDTGTAPPQAAQPTTPQPVPTAAPTAPAAQPTTAPSNAPDADTKAGASIPPKLVNDPSVPTQHMATMADLNKTSPAPHHSWLHQAALALAGGPTYDYKMDDAGNMVKTEVPVSNAHIGFAIALEALKGAAAGGGQHGPGATGRAAALGLKQGESDQEKKQQQDQQARKNATEESDQKQKVTEANFRTHQLAVLVGDKDKETSQAFADSFKPLADAVDDGTINLPGVQKMFETEVSAGIQSGKLNATNTTFIPYGEAQPIMEKGQQKEVNGVPVWGHNYMVIPNSATAKVALTEQIQKAGRDVGMFMNKDGTPANIGNPDWSFADIAQKMSTIAQVKTGEQLLQLHKNDAHDMIGKPAEDLDNLPTAVRNNPQMRTALQLYSKMSGTDSIDTILGKMNATDPQSASLLMQYLKLTPKDMEDMGNARLKAKTAAGSEAKEEAKETPEKLALDKANLAEKQANVQEKLSTISKNAVEEKKLNAETDKLLKDDTNTPATVDAIGTGHIAATRLDYILARKPELLDAVMKKYPDFDSSKTGAYKDAYTEFTKGKVSVSLNAARTAFRHLKELNDFNTDTARIPGTKDYQNYENKLDTVADELAKFYGNSTIPGIASYRKTLDATFNRGAAIKTQAESMSDKMDEFENQWADASPSKAYEAQMPGRMKPEAQQARAALDPRYAKRLQEEGGTGGQPANPQFSKVSASGKFGWDGKAWVAIPQPPQPSGAK